MEYLGKILKKTGWSSIITSTVFAIIGIVIITSPEAIITIISTILGLTLIAFGGYKGLEYLKNKGSNSYSYDLAYGIIAIILGIVAMVYHQEIGTIFRILIGLWIIYSSVIRATLSLQLRSTKSKVWIIYTISNAGTIVVAVGIVVLIYSILDIIEGIIFLNNLKKIV